MAESGPWQARVRFAPGGGLAYRPGELLVREETVEQARTTLGGLDDAVYPGDGGELLGGTWVRLTDVPDPLLAIEALRRRGVAAQPNHVLFANACCPPHPADPQAEAFYARLLDASPFYASPFYASPFYASPFYASAGAGGGCCCCCSGGSAGANPFYASPFYASPFYASADPNPAAASWMQATGRRRSSARPADPPEELPAEGSANVRIAILDTGYAASHQPGVLPNIAITPHGGDSPDEDGDNYLDPAAGHGTFIAGVIEQITPGCQLEVFEVLGTAGDGDESPHRRDAPRPLDSPRRRAPALRQPLVRRLFGARHGCSRRRHRRPRWGRNRRRRLCRERRHLRAAVSGRSSRSRGGGCARCEPQPGAVHELRPVGAGVHPWGGRREQLLRRVQW